MNSGSHTCHMQQRRHNTSAGSGDTVEEGLEFVLFNAARNNDIILFKSKLLHKTPNEVYEICSKRVHGSTLLVAACRSGSYEVADYLINVVKVVIEETGSVSFEGEPIEDASPLWCAAASGHMGIVNLLLKKGANVNSKTQTNSTPLRAACFDGHYEIAKHLIEHYADFEIANRHGHTCLMIACFKGHYQIARFLLEKGANVNRRSIKGNTALHDCAESGSLEILRLLLQYGAKMQKDCYGMTPLLAASVTGHVHIVNHMIALPCVARQERIDAVELLGATLIDKKRDITNAINHWSYALTMREEVPAMSKIVEEPIPAYDNVIEFTTEEELQDLFADPDQLRMQALIIRHRILGATHPDTTYYIRFRGAHYADAGRFDRCIQLWTYALTMQQMRLQALHPLTQQSLQSFAELFCFMLVETGRPLPRGRIVPPVSESHILAIFEKAISEIDRGRHGEQPAIDASPIHQCCRRSFDLLNKTLVSCLHLGCLLVTVTDEEEKLSEARRRTLELLRQLSKFKLRTYKGRSLLHYACCREASLLGRYPACQFPSLPLVKALLSIGASPNAVDCNGNTPLHVLALEQSPRTDIVRTLLKNGAHLDLANNKGETFESLLKNRNVSEYVNPLKYTTLVCLAARQVRKSGLEYYGKVPKSLYAVIETH